jgi:hypothetical protein
VAFLLEPGYLRTCLQVKCTRGCSVPSVSDSPSLLVLNGDGSATAYAAIALALPHEWMLVYLNVLSTLMAYIAEASNFTCWSGFNRPNPLPPSSHTRKGRGIGSLTRAIAVVDLCAGAEKDEQCISTCGHLVLAGRTLVSTNRFASHPLQTPRTCCVMLHLG